MLLIHIGEDVAFSMRSSSGKGNNVESPQGRALRFSPLFGKRDKPSSCSALARRAWGLGDHLSCRRWTRTPPQHIFSVAHFRVLQTHTMVFISISSFHFPAYCLLCATSKHFQTRADSESTDPATALCTAERFLIEKRSQRLLEFYLIFDRRVVRQSSVIEHAPHPQGPVVGAAVVLRPRCGRPRPYDISSRLENRHVRVGHAEVVDCCDVVLNNEERGDD